MSSSSKKKSSISGSITIAVSTCIVSKTIGSNISMFWIISCTSNISSWAGQVGGFFCQQYSITVEVVEDKVV